MIRMDMPGSRRFVATNVPLRNLIRFAYDVDEARLGGGPDGYAPSVSTSTRPRNLPTWTPAGPPPVVLSMLRSLLAQRFKLTTRKETRELPGQLVIDRTELTGRYNIQLSWTPQGMRLGGPPGGPPPAGPALPPVDPDGASLFVSIQEQLGLRLEPTRAPVEVVVIDQVERPTPD